MSLLRETQLFSFNETKRKKDTDEKPTKRKIGDNFFMGLRQRKVPFLIVARIAELLYLRLDALPSEPPRTVYTTSQTYCMRKGLAMSNVSCIKIEQKYDKLSTQLIKVVWWTH